MKKSIAIVLALGAIVLCGIPGVLILAGKLEGEYISSPEEAYLCGGILILIPIVIAIATFSNIDGGMKDVLFTGCMTIFVLTLITPIIGFLIFGAIHADDYDREEMGEAWAACSSATGNPSGNYVSGKVYEIDSIDAGSPGFGFTEYIGGPSILGYKYIDDEYKNFTKDLSKAGAVLCAEVKTTFFDYCNYPSDQKIEFTISYYHTEARLALLAWPSKELIAQTILTPTESFGDGCAPTVLRESDERFRQVYEPVDLDGWLDQYVTITK